MTRVILSALLMLLLPPAVGHSFSQAPTSNDAAPPPPAVSEPKSSVDSLSQSSPKPEADAQISGRTQPVVKPPPDREWLVDAEGRSYYIEKRPKTQLFMRIGDSRVRVAYGGEFDLAGEDEDELWLKIYRPIEEVIERRPVSKAPTVQELATSAATFEVHTLSTDRLLLRAFDEGLPLRGMWRNGFDLADINDDGEIDFVHGPLRRGGDQPKIFLGDGHGHWHPFAVAVPPGLLDYGDVKVADFNGDGKPDLAAASHLRGVLAFVGDGAGKFSSWREGLDFDVPRAGYDASGFSSRRIEVLDWNGDGRMDILALSEGPRIGLIKTNNATKLSGLDKGPEVYGPRLYLNQGDGTWIAVAESPAQKEVFGDDLAVADFDGDKTPDFLISTNAMARRDILFLQGKARGGPWTSVELPLREKAYVKAVSAGDFDRDGRNDIALTYTSFELGVARVGIDLYLARSAGRWERHPVFVRQGRVSISALDSGDVDGDSLQDIVATDHDGNLLLLLGDGKGGFSLEESPEAQQPRGNCRGYGLKLVDIDRDGRAEIVASFAGEGNALYDPKRCANQGGVAAWTLDRAK